MGAILREAALRSSYTGGEEIRTIYFGGGTPSILPPGDITLILSAIRSNFNIDVSAEITLEANPDDCHEQNLYAWKEAGINRLSIGVQSFHDEDLTWMNRAHHAQQAFNSIGLALTIFPNITIDLIYGTPFLSDERWKENVDRAIELGIPHLSCYALTVEPNTPLKKMIDLHKSPDTDPEKQSRQFLQLMEWLAQAGYEHYEVSNFAKPGMRSRHNSSYWKGEKYLGLGPSAHSYNGTTRQWNISNNQQYIQAISAGEIPSEIEELTGTQKLNEYIMISLRTKEGLDLSPIDRETADRILRNASRHQQSGHLVIEKDKLVLTREGMLFADGIAASLFF